ncbi:P-loop containing nucleoside triphosphate hydrolase protein [Trametes elegans]|nr:P-loop containing nucleoside triphosphate hydrolase protein [Trametes elegans]
MSLPNSKEKPAGPSPFNPHDAENVTHMRLGVWDIYQQRPKPKVAYPLGASLLERYTEIVEAAPYVRRLLHDIYGIPGCPRLLVYYGVTECANAVMPALALWYQGQLLQIMQTVLNTRTVDKDALLHICAGRVACTIASHFIGMCSGRVHGELLRRIGGWQERVTHRAHIRLDLPTYETSAVKRQLEGVTANEYSVPIAWSTFSTVSSFATTIMQTCAQVWVLVQVLNKQPEGLLYALLTLATHTIQWLLSSGMFGGNTRVWAATTSDQDYLRMRGWARILQSSSHRKEIVAGNLSDHAMSEYEKAADRVGDADREFTSWQFTGQIEPRTKYLNLINVQVLFTLQAMLYPSSMPMLLASSHMVQETTRTFTMNMFRLLDSSHSIAREFGNVRKLYAVATIPNKVEDGTAPFPEDSAQVRSGIALEFRNVSFKYPEADNYALRRVSFKVLPGQLCVIVGGNGSGKSTILKLIIRLYDPHEGQILLNGHDIRTLRLKDLRQTISVLFQDYTHFPFSIRENIAIGDPSTAASDDAIRLAARLGGADAFVEKLPDGYDTYLDRPVRDFYSGLPEGTTALFGRKVDFGAVQAAGGMRAAQTHLLSGGQMQRLAVARTFMRSVVPEDAKVGLMLFDEPSASLDPAAEHELFDRLRELRGSKTLLFSSHRFGNLTRHADLILYMSDSAVVESGTQEELLKRQGEYARLWTLQAQAFI